MIHHHPGEDLLLALAAGTLRAGQAIVVAAHLETCVECRHRLHMLQAIGGALLEAVEPAPLASQAWAGTLARIASPLPTRVPARRAVAASPRLPMPAGARWPASLRGCGVSRWRWMGPGMRVSRLRLPQDPSASLFLLRIAPGRSLPSHTHSGLELTQVLCGTFDDGRGVFGAGDFDAADGEVHHQPVVGSEGDCVCLAYVGGPLRFDGRIASMVGGLIGM